MIVDATRPRPTRNRPHPLQVPFLGAIINKVPQRDHAILSTQLKKRFDEGKIPLLGVLPEVRGRIGGSGSWGIVWVAEKCVAGAGRQDVGSCGLVWELRANLLAGWGIGKVICIGVGLGKSTLH